jgi:hypothetical protein
MGLERRAVGKSTENSTTGIVGYYTFKKHEPMFDREN